MTVRILNGDCLDRLATLADDSVHCIVTSPPYWGLRDYGVAGQLGLEPTLGEHLETMVVVFRELRRVLRPDGTCWLNYGDSYATTVNGWRSEVAKAAGNDDRDKPFSTVHGVFKTKDLMMIPNRLAIALQEDGWYVRNECIWAKRNPMPESARDRAAQAHEKIFLLTKSPRYFFDAEAVRMPSRCAPGRANGHQPGKAERAVTPQSDGHINHTTLDQTPRGEGRALRAWEDDVSPIVPPIILDIATKPFPGAHFATFPPDLAAVCIKAGCPENGVVLDPFGGAGTTGLVADRLRRDAILIELSADYCEIARARIEDDAGGLFGAAVEMEAQNDAG